MAVSTEIKDNWQIDTVSCHTSSDLNWCHRLTISVGQLRWVVRNVNLIYYRCCEL